LPRELSTPFQAVWPPPLALPEPERLGLPFRTGHYVLALEREGACISTYRFGDLAASEMAQVGLAGCFDIIADSECSCWSAHKYVQAQRDQFGMCGKTASRQELGSVVQTHSKHL
jgi:hypothetical protein